MDSGPDDTHDEFLIRLFGVERYEAARTLPRSLLQSAIRIEQQRQAEARLIQARDTGIAAGLKLGLKYIDPKNPHGGRKSDEPYNSLEPYLKHLEGLERQAYPWLWTPEAIIRRREMEEERAFEQMERAMGAMSA